MTDIKMERIGKKLRLIANLHTAIITLAINQNVKRRILGHFEYEAETILKHN